MLKKLLMFGCCMCVCTAVQSAAGQEKEVREIAGRLSTGLASADKKTVAVVDFTDLRGCVTELGRFMAEEFSASLAEGGKGLQVVDRTNLNVIIHENHLAEKGIIDPATARKLGQIAGVDALISGTLVALGDNVHLSVKALDAANARIIAATQGDLSRTKGIDELLARGVDGCGGAGARAAELRVDPPPPIGAISKVQFKNVDFQILSCSRSGGEVECVGILTNRSEDTQRVRIGGITAVDNGGNQSTKGSAWMGVSDLEINLTPDLPLKFHIKVSTFGPESSNLTILMNIGIEPSTSHGPPEYQVLAFRHVPLPSQ